MQVVGQTQHAVLPVLCEEEGGRYRPTATLWGEGVPSYHYSVGVGVPSYHYSVWGLGASLTCMQVEGQIQRAILPLLCEGEGCLGDGVGVGVPHSPVCRWWDKHSEPSCQYSVRERGASVTGWGWGWGSCQYSHRSSRNHTFYFHIHLGKIKIFYTLTSIKNIKR